MAKSKLNLHSYQQDILAKLKEATETGVSGVSSKLGIRVGGAFWLVSLADVNEVLPVPTIASVPLTKPWFLGVANVRGVLYGVNDFEALRGMPNVSVGRDSRLLLAHQRFDANVALLLSQLIGLRNTSEMQLQPEIDGKPDWQLGRYLDGLGQFWDELDIRILLNQQEFMQISA